MELSLIEKIRNNNFILIPVAILGAAVIIAGSIMYKGDMNEEKGFEAETATSTITIGSTAPSFSLKTSKGIKISSEDLKNKDVLLVFWSSQCQYGAQELEDLKKFTNKYRNTIAVIAIDYMETLGQIKEYEEKENINFTVLLDADGKIFEKYNVDGTPYHFLIGKNGKIAAIWPNYANLVVLGGLVNQLKPQ